MLLVEVAADVADGDVGERRDRALAAEEFGVHEGGRDGADLAEAFRAQAGGASHSAGDRGATFGERRAPGASSRKSGGSKQARTEDAPMEISWVPSGSAGKAGDDGEGKAKAKAPRRKGVESFGAGLGRGVEETVNADDAERQGRTQRRKGVRSGSKNVFRQMDR